MPTTEQISPETLLGFKRSYLAKLMRTANDHNLFPNRSEYAKSYLSILDKELAEVEENIKTLEEILTKKGIKYERC